MRIYIICNDGITVCREVPETGSEREPVISSKEELHAAALSGKRLLRLWNTMPGVVNRRSIGDRTALIDELWVAMENLPDPQPAIGVKPVSKQEQVLAMLRRTEGATVDEVTSATGWQRHTVRGLFAGTLKRRLGLILVSTQEERGRVYRIIDPAGTAAFERNSSPGTDLGHGDTPESDTEQFDARN